ncbi:MAG: MSHA biogenesis protein MshJ [Alphaproteobacteria bacterium]|jgi:MSHA biogenesis protein MshJ
MKPKHPAKQSPIKKRIAAFDGLKKREQNLLFLVTPLTIIAVFFLLLIEPEINTSQRLTDSVSKLENQLAMSRQSNNELLKQGQIDPNTTVSQQISSLQKRLVLLNAEFEGELNQLVSPQAMPVLLEQLFEGADNLSLINMKSVAPQVLMTNGTNSQRLDEKPSAASEQQPIFRHGIEITFEGSFFATREFLSRAEGLGWKLYWQDLSYVVSEHPNAVTKMTLFTLSTSEAFIGVN